MCIKINFFFFYLSKSTVYKTCANCYPIGFPLDGDMTEADKKKAQVERHRRAALRSSVIQELRQQYSDAPEEIRERRDFQSERDSREELHRFLLSYMCGICFM